MGKKPREKEGDKDKYFCMFISLFLWMSPLYDNLHIARNRFLEERVKFEIFRTVFLNTRNS